MVDVGGGTTDCTMIRAGPSYRDRADRTPDVLGTDGVRHGGRDLDAALADGAVAPLLGKGTYLTDDLLFPGYYVDGALSMHLPRWEEFLSVQAGVRLRALANRSRAPECVARLVKVQKERLGDYVLWQAEQAKIGLSRRPDAKIELDRIEAGLRASVRRDDYERFAERTHRRLMAAVEEVARQAGTRPEEVFLTGGMAQSPSLRAALRARVGDTKVVDGDFFGNVACGLTTWGHRRSQAA